MNLNNRTPIPFCHEGAVLAYACPVCQAVYSAGGGYHDYASTRAVNCCPPHHCEGGCGTVVDRRTSHMCDACWAKKRAEDRAKQAAEDAKRPIVGEDEWHGPVHLDGHEETGWYSSTDALYEDLLPEDVPDWAWTCDENTISLDAHDILENATQDSCESAVDDAMALVPELQAILDEFCAKHKVTWWTESNTRVRLNRPEVGDEEPD